MFIDVSLVCHQIVMKDPQFIGGLQIPCTLKRSPLYRRTVHETDEDAPGGKSVDKDAKPPRPDHIRRRGLCRRTFVPGSCTEQSSKRGANRYWPIHHTDCIGRCGAAGPEPGAACLSEFHRR